MQFRLGAALTALRGVHTCSGCGHRVDPRGLHYMEHSQAGTFYWRHDAVRDVWADMLRMFYRTVIVEDPAHGSYSPGARPDISVYDYQRAEQHLLLDVVIAHPCLTSYVRRAARTSLATAEGAAAAKMHHYREAGASGNTITPLAFETFGGMCKAAEELFRDLSRRRADRLAQEAELRTSTASTFTSFWVSASVACCRDPLPRDSSSVRRWTLLRLRGYGEGLLGPMHGPVV